MKKPVEIHVHIDPAMFRRYCAFDTFRRQRRWYLPVMAGMVLMTIAVGGLLGLIPVSDAVAGVLMGLGIAVPLGIFGLYFIQIEAQIAAQHLKENPEVYCVRLDDAGVRISAQNQTSAEVPWEKLWAAFRRPDAVYLYVSPERALILPDAQTGVSREELWRYIVRMMGEKRCIDKA